MSKHQVQGLEGDFGLTDLPVLTLAQAQSAAVMEGNIEGLKPGRLMNNITKEPLGDSIALVAYSGWGCRCKFAPRGEGNVIECASPDKIKGSRYGTCNACAFNRFDLKDKCHEQLMFIVAPLDNPSDMMRLIFSKTSMVAGSKLTKMLKAEGAKKGLDLYQIPFTLSSRKVKNEKQGTTYFVMETALFREDIGEEKLAELKENFSFALQLRKGDLEKFYARLEASGAEGDEGINPGSAFEAPPEEAPQEDGSGDALL